MEDRAITLDDILARKQDTAGAVVNVDEPTVKLVFFSLGNAWYAFRGENVSEVLADCDVFFLPGLPSSLEGVINVRGDIESVIRLRTLLGLPEVDTAVASRILLCQSEAMRSGIRVDRVEEVLDIMESTILPPPHAIPESLRPIVIGIISYQEHMIHLLDLERIFEDYRLGLR